MPTPEQQPMPERAMNTSKMIRLRLTDHDGGTIGVVGGSVVVKAFNPIEGSKLSSCNSSIRVGCKASVVVRETVDEILSMIDEQFGLE